MSIIRNILLIGMVLGTLCTSVGAVVKTVGGAADGTLPPAPTGLCTGGRTLQLTDGGTVTTTVSATQVAVFKAAPLENSYGGVGYALSSETATSNTRLVIFNLDNTPATITGNVLVNTAANPDLSNVIRANIYDSTRIGSGGFLEFGTQVTIQCTGGSVNCLHIRGYSDTTTLIDIAYPSINTVSGFFSAYMVSDSSSYWVAYTTVGGSAIRKLNGGLTSVGVIADTPNLYGDITSDSIYVYATLNIGGVQNIRRINISDLTITDFPLVGAASAVAIYYYNGNLYVGVVQGGTGNIKRVETTGMTVTGTLVLGPTEAIIQGGQLFDIANNRLYTVSIDGATAVYRRINLTTFISEQSLVNAVGFPEIYGTGFDLPHQHIWQVTRGTNLLLTKINVCS